MGGLDKGCKRIKGAGGWVGKWVIECVSGIRGGWMCELMDEVDTLMGG